MKIAETKITTRVNTYHVLKDRTYVFITINGRSKDYQLPNEIHQQILQLLSFPEETFTFEVTTPTSDDPEPDSPIAGGLLRLVKSA